MPKWSSELFQNISVLNYDFNNDPSGEMVLERILHGMPAFLHLSGDGETPKKKKLVINNWSLSVMSEADKTKLRYLINALLADGFEIYQQQADGIVRIETLADFQFNKYLHFNMESLFKALAKHEVSRDEQVILDYELINQLIGRTYRDAPIGRRIDLQDVVKVGWSKKTLKTIIHGQSELILSTIDIEQASETMLEQVLQANAYHLTVDNVKDVPKVLAFLERLDVRKIKTLVTSNLLKRVPLIDWTRAIASKAEHLEHYRVPKETDLDRATFNSSLKSIRINQAIRLSQLKTITDTVKGLEEFALRTHITADISEGIDLSRLRRFYLFNVREPAKGAVSTHSEGVITLLRSLENVAQLSIDDVNEQEFQSLKHLRQLARLDIDDGTVNAADLSAVINNNPMLIKLQVHSVNIKGELGALNLRQLEHLSIASFHSNTSLDRTLSDENVSQLIRQARQLKSLYIFGQQFNSLQQLPNIASLEQLDIEEATIFGEDLSNLLSSVETAKLKSVSVEGDLAHLESPRLKDLTISGSTLTARQFQTLMLNAEHLTRLIIDNPLDGEYQKGLAFNCSDLRVLQSNSVSVNSDHLVALLANAKNIESIDLTHGEIMAFESSINYSNLTHINLTDITITAEALEALLNSASNLKHLNLKNVTIEGELKNPLNLQKLESFTIDNDKQATVSQNTFFNLVGKATKLKTIALTGLIVNSSSELQLAQFPRLESISLADVIMTSETFKMLFMHSQSLSEINFKNRTGLGGNFSGLNYPVLKKIRLEGDIVVPEGMFDALLSRSIVKPMVLAKKGTLKFSILKELMETEKLDLLDLHAMTITEIDVSIDINSRLRELRLSSVYEQMNAKKINFFDYFTQQALPSVKKLIIDQGGRRVSLKQRAKFTAVEELDLSSALSASDVFKIQKARDSIRESIEAIPDIKVELSPAMIETLVDHFQFALAEIKDRNVYYLIHQNDKLKKLNLSKLTFYGTLRPVYCPQLREIDLSHASISLSNLRYLIEGASKHVKVDLSHCEIAATPFEFFEFIKRYQERIEGEPKRIDEVYNSATTIKKLKAQAKEEGRRVPSILSFFEGAEWGEQVESYNGHGQGYDEPPEGPNFNKDRPSDSATPSPTSEGHHRQIINQLCRYIESVDYLSTKEKKEIVDSAQHGICNALAHYFSYIVTNSGEKTFKHVILKTLGWDGAAVDRQLAKIFDDLISFVDSYQRLGVKERYRYLTTDVAAMLRENTIEQPIYFFNGWHQIAVIKKENGYLILDPNYHPMRPKLLHGVEEVSTEVYRVLGHGVGIESAVKLKNVSLDRSEHVLKTYIRDGGLINIIHNSTYHGLLKDIIAFDLTFDELIEALFPLSNNYGPIWALGLMKSNARTDVLSLLQQAMDKNTLKFTNLFIKSFTELDSDQKNTIKYFLTLAAKTNEFARELCQINVIQLASAALPQDFYGSADAGSDIDSDTRDSDSSFDANKIFYASAANTAPSVSMYRLNVYNDFRLSSGSDSKPFKIFNRDELQLEEAHLKLKQSELLPYIDQMQKKVSNRHVYIADMSLRVSDKWQPLPSVDASETMHHFYASDHLYDLDIKYSKRDDMYYIRSNNKETFDIDIQYSLTVEAKAKEALPRAISDLIEKYRSFGEGELQFEETNPSARTQLDAIQTQQIGACRHRMVAFFDEMERRYPDVKVRMVTNVPHAYVEILHLGNWYRCNLGGYLGNINIFDKHQTVETEVDMSYATSNSEDEGQGESDRLSASGESIGSESGTSLPTTPVPMVEAVGGTIPDEAISSLIDSFSVIDKPTDLAKNQPFRTWESDSSSEFDSLSDFDKSLFNIIGANCLLTISDNQQLEAYKYHLLQLANKVKRPVYIINDFNELKCSQASLTMDGELSGVIKGSPSGPLYDFLQENDGSNPIIIVNWNNFSAKEIVKANTIIDAERKADGVALPHDATVIGLYNMSKSNAYHGSDFSSRHHYTARVPFIGTLDVSQYQIHDVSQDGVRQPGGKSHDLDGGQQVVYGEPETVEIDLYNSVAWQPLLFGQWKIDGQELNFLPSALIEALLKNPSELTLTISNPPSEQADFKHQINMMLERGYIDYFGRRFKLPAKYHISYQQGYEFEELLQKVNFCKARAKDYDYTLNPSNNFSLYQSYRIEDLGIVTGDGIFHRHRGQAITLYVTRNIDLFQWAKLLTTAKDNHVSLNIVISPEVQLDETMTKHIEFDVLPEEETLQQAEASFCELHLTNDMSFTEEVLLKEQALNIDYSVDISEVSTDSVFYKITGRLEDEAFVFDETISDIWRAVCVEGKSILLKGKFKKELADQLASLFNSQRGFYYNGAYHKPRGKLILLTEDASEFSYTKAHKMHQVSLSDKLSKLPSLNKFEEHELRKLSYSQLRVLAKKSNTIDSVDALLSPLYKLTEPDSIASDFDLSELAATTFTAARLEKLVNAIETHPVAFLSGKTGVGKSSFMHQLNESARYPHTVFFGDTEAWAKASFEKGELILFVDEANLENTDWSMFETLMNIPPSIMIGGKYFELTPHHKVIFAGNPLSYGGERTMPSLFTNHPNVVTFHAMTNAFLYQRVLKPLIRTFEDSQSLVIAEIFLKVYQKVKSFDETSISARELQMMAFLLLTIMRDGTKPDTAAKRVALEVAIQCLDKKHIKLFNVWFDETIGAIEDDVIDYPERISDFILQPSHHDVYLKLNKLLDVRLVKQDPKTPLSYGGISGMILEGEPGLGKSHLIKALLLSRGFVEKKPVEEVADEEQLALEQTDRVFYHIPASSSIAVKINTLKKAFHEGAVVIADELNSSVTLERLINALLVGEDMDGKRALKPGFTLLATQNPITFAGRNKTSLAIKRRTWQCDFKPYSTNEMVFILQQFGLGAKEALSAVLAFNQAKDFASTNQLTPPPSFRDLVNVARDYPNYSKALGRDNEFFVTIFIQYLTDKYLPVKHDAFITKLEALNEIDLSSLSYQGYPFDTERTRLSEKTKAVTAFVKEFDKQIGVFKKYLSAMDATYEKHPLYKRFEEMVDNISIRNVRKISKRKTYKIESTSNTIVKSANTLRRFFYNYVKPYAKKRVKRLDAILHEQLSWFDSELANITESCQTVSFDNYGLNELSLLSENHIQQRNAFRQIITEKKEAVIKVLRDNIVDVLRKGKQTAGEKELLVTTNQVIERIEATDSTQFDDILKKKYDDVKTVMESVSPIYTMVQLRLKHFEARTISNCLFSWVRAETNEKYNHINQLLTSIKGKPSVFLALVKFKDRHGNFSYEDIIENSDSEEEMQAKKLFNALNCHRHFWNRGSNSITTNDKDNAWRPTQSWKDIKALIESLETPTVKLAA